MSWNQQMTMMRMLMERKDRLRNAKTPAEKQAILDEINKAMEEQV